MHFFRLLVLSLALPNRLTLARLLVSLCCIVPLAAQAAEGVERGDVLRVSVLEEPTLARDAKVDADGQIALPRLGRIAVAGQDLDQIRALIEAALVQRDIIREPTVLVEVALYRPVYVGGAVVNPGAVAFEPGLTVRHAIILAGGPERGLDGSFLNSAEMLSSRTTLQAAAYQLLQVNSLILRLDAELVRAPSPVAKALDRRFVTEREADGIISLDRRLLEDRVQQWREDQVHLQEAVALVDVEIEVLKQQTELQKAEQKSQQAELDNARTLFERALIPLTRLQEVERETSRLSRELLDSQAFLARANQNKSDKQYELTQAETLWRIQIQRDLRAAMLDKARLTAEVDILRDQMLAAGLLLGADGSVITTTPEVTIHRSTGTKVTSVKAGMETELRAGDLLDVAIARVPNG